MKRILCFVLIQSIGTGFLMAQSPCPPNNITTNPANPSPATPPPGKEFKRNNFDWKAQFLQADNSSYYTTNSPLTNFFNYEVNNPNFEHIAKGVTSDYYPEEGWELIKQDFGRLANGALNPVRSEGPYLVLYNKYSGILRVLAAFPGLGAQQTVNVKISFKPKVPGNSNQDQLGLSALFNSYGPVARAMDQATVIDNVVTPSVFPGSDRRFFYADFQTSYDPCSCLFESALIVEFSIINVFTAQLSGRLLGVSEPIATYLSNTYKLDKNKDFLTSLFQNDASTNNVQSGALMYTSIDKLVADYAANAAQKPATNGFLQALNGWKDLMTIGQVLTVFAGDTWPAAMGAIGTLTTFLSSKIKAPGSPTPTTFPTVIHGEMTLTGTINDTRALPSSYFTFAVPGSKKSNDKPEYNDGVIVSPPDVDYPIYNEALGTFALLESPKIQPGNVSGGWETACWDDGGPAGDTYPVTYQLGRDLKYVYNPKANIDDQISKISAAWVLEIGPSGWLGCGNYDNPINVKKVKTRTEGFYDYTTYISSFMPLDDFKNFSAGARLSNDYTIVHAYVRLRIEMVSNDLDRAGNKNQAVMIVTYEATPEFTYDIPSVYCPTYSVDPIYNFNGPWYTWSTDIRHWGTAVINVPLSAPFPVTIRAQGFIFGPNGSAGSNITLITTNHVTPGIHRKAQTQAEVTDFCTSTSGGFKYKANLATRTRPSNAIAPIGVQIRRNEDRDTEFNFDLFPNPASSYVNIRYSLPTARKINIYVTDVTGQVVGRVVNGELQSAGDHTKSFSTANLAAGLYYYTIESDNFKETKKFTKTK